MAVYWTIGRVYHLSKMVKVSLSTGYDRAISSSDAHCSCSLVEVGKKFPILETMGGELVVQKNRSSRQSSWSCLSNHLGQRKLIGSDRHRALFICVFDVKTELLSSSRSSRRSCRMRSVDSRRLCRCSFHRHNLVPFAFLVAPSSAVLASVHRRGHHHDRGFGRLVCLRCAVAARWERWSGRV